MTNQEKAVKYFESMNCNQSVLATYGPQFGVSEDLCFRLGLSFGGGMAKLGKTCGVVTGAYTVIGLWSSTQSTDKAEQKQIAIDKVNEFNILFEKDNKSLICKTLLGYSMSKPEELKIIQEKDLTNIICPKLVADATKILDRIIR